MTEPSFMTKATGFTVSMIQWIRDGCPLRDPQETLDLFEGFCKTCPEYDPEHRPNPIWPKGICKECGCHVGPHPSMAVNKVNKPHAGCPLGKWQPIVVRDDPT